MPALRTRSPNPSGVRGLRAIRELPGLRRRILVHAGSERGRTPDGIDVRGLSDLAAELDAGALWTG